MAEKIKGNEDGEGGRNESYRIPGRSSNIPRKQLVREVKDGKHPNFSVYTREGEEYVRANPNHMRKDNVDD